jgi:hypothetical protein
VTASFGWHARFFRRVDPNSLSFQESSERFVNLSTPSAVKANKGNGESDVLAFQETSKRPLRLPAAIDPARRSTRRATVVRGQRESSGRFTVTAFSPSAVDWHQSA